MRRVFVVAVLCCAPLLGQPQTIAVQPLVEPAPPDQKLFILKYADPQRVSSLLGVFGSHISMSANAEMHALAVTAPHSVMTAIDDAIAKLDIPASAPKDFDFTVYLVVGTEGENIGASMIPKELDPVVTQLRGAFAFKNYRLLDVLTIRSRAGQNVSTQSSGGVVRVGSVDKLVNTNFSIRSATMSADGGTIRLDRMSCSSKVPTEDSPGHYTTQNLSLDTDLDIKEGQKVVVGRMGMTNQQAMFVVITVKIVQ